MELDKHRLAFLVDQSESGGLELAKWAATQSVYPDLRMDTKTFNLTETSRNTATRESPENSVQSFWEFGEEIIGSFVSCTGLRNFLVWLWFASVDQVWELDTVYVK